MDTTRSQAMQDKAQRLIPGMTQLLSKRPDQFSRGVWPGYYTKAKGAEVWDLDGNHYIDMSISGIGANVLGYADPDVDGAVKKAIDNGVSCSLNCPEEVELAELLCEIHPWAQKVRYTRAGGEAMAVAVRIARASTGREKIAFSGYHGWHDWYLAANLGSENALGEHLLPGLSPSGVPKSLAGTSYPFRYNHAEELEAILDAHPGEVAVVVMEPIRTTKPENQFLQKVRQLATKHGCVLIIDEISAGFRLNSGGAHMLLDVAPDIAVFSKAMGNGYPIAAVIGRDSVMDAAQGSFISSTNWTERVGPAAALATIRKHLKLNAAEHLVAVGTAMQKCWQAAADNNGIPIHVGGIPPLSHFSFAGPAPLETKAMFVQQMLERGFLASTSFYSMYAHTLEHVQAYAAAADSSFKEIAKFKDPKALAMALRGKPSVAGFKRLT